MEKQKHVILCVFCCLFVCLDVVVPRPATITVWSLLCLHERRTHHHRRPPGGLWFLHLPGHQCSRKCVDEGAPGGGRRWDFSPYSHVLNTGWGYFYSVKSANEEKTYKLLSRCITIRHIKTMKQHSYRPYAGWAMNFTLNVLPQAAWKHQIQAVFFCSLWNLLFSSFALKFKILFL